MFVNRFATFVVPFLVLYLTRIGYTPAQAGLAVGAYGAGHLMASVLGGHLADRIGRRNTIVLSMFSSAAAMLLLSQMRTYGAIVGVACLAGLASEMYRPAASALLVDLVRPDQRVFAFGMYRFAINFAFASGQATAGFLAEHSFFYLFLGDALSSIAYGIIALAALPHGLRTHSPGERVGEALRSAANNTPFLLFLLATVSITLVDFQMGSTFALHVKAVGLRTRDYGLLLSINGVLIVVFELLITTVTQRFSPRRVIGIGYFLSGIGFSLTGVASAMPALAATVVLWTLGEMISSPMASAYVAQLAPEKYRGRYMGLLAVALSFGLLAGPALGTLVYQWNATVLWSGCAVLGCISAAILLPAPRAQAAASASHI